MKISNIKIQRIEDENNAVKATVTVTFGNYIVVRNIKIVKSPQSTFIAMPSIKIPNGEIKDICHPITKEFRDYVQKNILDVFNSGETEKTFEYDFNEPKIDIQINIESIGETNIGYCNLIVDEEFAIHNIRVMAGDKIAVVFPRWKTKDDTTESVCDFINNRDKHYNQILNTFIEMIEDKSEDKYEDKSEDKYEDKSEDKSEKLNANAGNEDDAPGWDAITNEAERVYPNQKNPKHYGTIIKYYMGGNDPIDGISVYDGGDYWHFVTYGLSELYEKRTNNKEISGYGMEFTFKLKKDNYSDEEAEIRNICGILQSFARITFSKGEVFNEYEYLYSGQTTGIDVNRKSNITGFITIPDKDLRPIDTPNGRVKFVEFIGATDDELKAIINKKIRVKELYEKIGNDVTDYHRKSAFENTGDKFNINKLVENPELKWLINKYSTSSDDQKNEIVESILQKIAEESRLLSVVVFSQPPTQKDDGTSTIEAGTKMGFPTVTYQSGKYVYFPAYTDWEELMKNSNLDKDTKTMVFKFDDYATFVLDQSNDDGLVINPYSEHPFFLSRKQMEHIRNVKNNNTTKKINDDENTTQKHSEALVSKFFPSSIEVIRDIVNNNRDINEKETFIKLIKQLGNKYEEIENKLIVYFNEPAKMEYTIENNKVQKIFGIFEDGKSYVFERKSLEPKNDIKQNNEQVDIKGSGLKAFPFETEGYPRFVFYFPEDLGIVKKPYSNVFEIINDKVQKVRVMVSKCKSFDNFKSDTQKWIEKNKLDGKMEDVSYRNEVINDISIEVYELKYLEHPEWPHKLYKVGFVEGYRITISGWLVKGREKIIDQAFEKLTIDKS